MCKNSAKSLGFTLVELMITLAIAGILLAVGIPSFNSIIRSTRLTSYANELVTSLNLARSEAIKRGQQVVVNKTGAEWENGWQVFVDVDRDTPASDADTFNDDGDTTLCEVNEDCLIRTYASPLTVNFTLRSTPSYTDHITYQSSGMSANGSFVICDNSDKNDKPEANTSRLIIINKVGRVRMGVDTDNDGIPEKDDGEIISCIKSPFTK